VLAHLDLAIERQIDQIAGDGKVIGCARLDVGDDGVDDGVAHVAAAIALPVDVTDHPLGGEIAIGYTGKRSQVDIGNMREPEHPSFISDARAAFHPRFRG
jgi:hypothetical protein